MERAPHSWPVQPPQQPKAMAESAPPCHWHGAGRHPAEGLGLGRADGDRADGCVLGPGSHGGEEMVLSGDFRNRLHQEPGRGNAGPSRTGVPGQASPGHAFRRLGVPLCSMSPSCWARPPATGGQPGRPPLPGSSLKHTPLTLSACSPPVCSPTLSPLSGRRSRAGKAKGWSGATAHGGVAGLGPSSSNRFHMALLPPAFPFPTLTVSEIKTLSRLSANSRREGLPPCFWGLRWCGILIRGLVEGTSSRAVG